MSRSRSSPPPFRNSRTCWDSVVTPPQNSPDRYRAELHGHSRNDFIRMIHCISTSLRQGKMWRRICKDLGEITLKYLNNVTVGFTVCCGEAKIDQSLTTILHPVLSGCLIFNSFLFQIHPADCHLLYFILYSLHFKHFIYLTSTASLESLNLTCISLDC